MMINKRILTFSIIIIGLIIGTLITYFLPTRILSLKSGGIIRHENAAIIKREAYNDGLKLIASLSSGRLRKGDTLTINATLLNINNTEEITFAALYGEMKIRIFNEYGNMVYGEAMIAPGPTAPFPIFRPGERITRIFKWDTSKNILNGNSSPSAGNYHIEVEAYVTNLETRAKIMLRIGKMEVELLD
jgi:hypothetical protein